MLAGYLHPMIHLGFGIEFKQPAIIAEALGQTAIHPTWHDQFFIEADKVAQQSQQSSDCLVSIIDKIRADEVLSTAARWEDDEKIRDGIMVRAKQEMTRYASQWKVEPDSIYEACAEIINTCGKYAKGQRQWKRFDSGSIYRWGCAAPPQGNQLRLLLYARYQQLHFLFCAYKAALD